MLPMLNFNITDLEHLHDYILASLDLDLVPYV